MKTRLCLLMTVIGLLLAPFGGAAQEEADWFLPENPLEGRRLFYEKLCVTCHSIQGVGGRAGPDLGEVRLGGFTGIASKLWNHFPRMKEAFRDADLEWPQLTTEDARKLIGFLYFLNYFDKAADASIGERLFHVKNCIRCHSVGGQGGSIGPELDLYQSDFAAPMITAALWNNGPKMMKEMRRRKVPRPQFQERDVVDILAFIRANGLSDKTERKYLSPGNPVRGKALFASKRCVRCHAIRGAGGGVGPDLAKASLKGSLSFILSQMWNHGSNMWPRMAKEGVRFPRFTPQEMSDLIAYLYFLDFDTFPGSKKRGQRIFRKKRCKGCHVPTKPGKETIGPDLSEADLDTPFTVLAEMWNHAPAIERKMHEQGIRWPLLEEDEMRDLIEYLMSLRESD